MLVTNEHATSLLERVVAAQEAQAKATQLIADRLDLLIQAMAEENVAEDPDAQPLRYMDGSPCR
jgi:hypothetical protein